MDKPRKPSFKIRDGHPPSHMFVIAKVLREKHGQDVAASWLEEYAEEFNDALTGREASRQNFHTMQLAANELRKERDAARETNRKLHRVNQTIEREAYRSGRHFAFKFFREEFMRYRRALTNIGNIVGRRYPEDVGVSTDELVRRALADRSAVQ